MSILTNRKAIRQPVAISGSVQFIHWLKLDTAVRQSAPGIQSDNSVEWPSVTAPAPAHPISGDDSLPLVQTCWCTELAGSIRKTLPSPPRPHRVTRALTTPGPGRGDHTDPVLIRTARLHNALRTAFLQTACVRSARILTGGGRRSCGGHLGDEFTVTFTTGE